MTEILFLAGDYIKGKSVYPAFRRILNLLFNISIASFIFEKKYGTYSWFNFNDYKRILDFFVKGEFFIPFCIFMLVYAITQFFSISVFTWLNHFKTMRITRSILYYQFKKESIDARLKDLNKVSKVVSPIRLDKNRIIEVYSELRTKITPEMFKRLEKNLLEPKKNIEENFITTVRMMVAITIYFASLPQFSWFLYILSIAVLILGVIILTVSYWILDIVPTLARALHFQAEEYMKIHDNEIETDDN